MKRLLAVLLCALTALTAFSCGDGGKTNAPGETTSGAAETQTETTTEPPEYTAPGKNYNGAQFTFFIWHVDTKWLLTTFDGIFAKEETGEPMNDSIYRRTAKVEETLGVKIKTFLSTGGWAADAVSPYTQSILAGDTTYSAGIINGSNLKTVFGTDGLLYDLNKLETLDLSKSWWDPKATDEFTIGGKAYTTTGDMCVYTTGAVGCLYFNKEMIGEYKLESPYKLVSDKKWTLDKLNEQSAAVSRDLDGNGTFDEKDVLGIGCSKTVLQQCVCSSGIRVTTKNKSGVSELTLNNPKTTLVIDKVVGLIRNPKVAMYSDDYASKATTGDAFTDVMLPSFMENRLLFNFNWIFAALDLRNMDADFGILPMPLYDEKQDEYYSQLSTGWAAFVTVPATCKDTELTGNVFDAMGYYSQQYVTTAFIDTTVTSKALRDEESVAVMELLYDSMTYDLYDVYAWSGIFNAVTDCATKKENNFTSAYAAKEAAAKTAIKTTFDQLLG